MGASEKIGACQIFSVPRSATCLPKTPCAVSRGALPAAGASSLELAIRSPLAGIVVSAHAGFAAADVAAFDASAFPAIGLSSLPQPTMMPLIHKAAISALYGGALSSGAIPRFHPCIAIVCTTELC